MKFLLFRREFGQHLAIAEKLVYLGRPGQRLLVVVQGPLEDPHEIGTEDCLGTGLWLDIVLFLDMVPDKPFLLIIKRFLFNSRLVVADYTRNISVSVNFRHFNISDVVYPKRIRIIYIYWHSLIGEP